MSRALLLIVLFVASSVPLQTGAITGHVYDDAGRPVADARVTAVSRTAGAARSSRTTPDGSFSLTGLPDGTYALTAERPGYETRQYGQTAIGGPGTPLALSDGGRQDATIVVNRHGSISGRVFDEYGRPLRSRITALRWAERFGIRAQMPMKTTMSDRHGRYTLAALPPGEYTIAAVHGSEDLQAMTPSLVAQARMAIDDPGAPLPIARDTPGATAYVTSYYPGVPSPAAATPVDVGPGAARTGIDLKALLMPTSRVEGRVLNADGSPAGQTVVVVAGLGTSQPTGHIGQTSPDGSFSINGVPRGTYLLIVNTTSTTVQVTSPVVSDVTLTLPDPVPVAGRVEFIGDAPRPASGAVRVVLLPAPSSLLANVPPPAAVLMVRENGVFEGSVSPGIYRASVVEAGPTATWTAESAKSDGRDLLDEAINVTSTRPLTNLAVTLVDSPTEISGSLRRRDGSPEPGVVMVAFSADRQFWTSGTRRVASARPDPQGRYRLVGLPPGEYLVGAVGEFDTTNGIPAGVLEPLVAASTPVSLRRGQRVEQDFVIGGGERR